MRKVVYAMTVSLDGFIESSKAELDWSFPDEELHRHFIEREGEIDIHLYGRRLYEMMAAYWPTADANPAAPAFEVEYARIWRAKPKLVFSQTLREVKWNSRLVKDDVAAEVDRLKAESGKYMSVGGPGLASSLMKLGLVDEFWLYISPIILGGGKPMFLHLEAHIPVVLMEQRGFGCGVTLMRYRKR